MSLPVSRKSEKIAAFVDQQLGDATGGWDPRYAGFFTCFNGQRFYEAHDVLEDLWLAGGKTGSNYAFHKGLIQLAGAFVHLQKNRLGPAVALFNLAEANLCRYPDVHDGIEIPAIRGLIHDWRRRIEDSGNARNPLVPGAAPGLEVPRSIGN